MSQPRDMTAVFQHIEQTSQNTLADLSAFCSQPSVSTESRGMAEMVRLARARLERSNFAVEVVPLEGGFPVVYAESRDEVPADAPVLLIYNHYDVQPEGDLDLWTSPPFAPEVRDGKFYARGVADNKGNIIARLAAIDALRAVFGKLPLKIKWVIEGEEEIGSPSLDRFMAAHRARLDADGCVWEFGGFSWDGTPMMWLGLKGILLVELRCQGPRRDLHSSMASFVASPVWRLVWALSTLKDENEYVAVEGFYDSLRPPSATELAMVAALPDDDELTLRNLGLREFAAGVAGYQRRLAEIFSPTCNIQGLSAGYGGEGSKTILPARATAKLDLRLVPDQDPDEVLQQIRSHLDAKGFDDVEVVPFEGSLFPARTNPDHPFVQVARDVAAELNGGAPAIVSPSSAASGPMHSFTAGLGVPVVAIGTSYAGSAQHAPDENIRLDDFERGIKMIALLIQRMAEAGAERFRSFQQAPTARAASGNGATAHGATIDGLPTGLPETDMSAVLAEMDGGIDESRLIAATRRSDVEDALEDVQRAEEIADELRKDDDPRDAVR